MTAAVSRPRPTGTGTAGLHLRAAAVAEPTPELAPLPGFVESVFSPLVFEACRRCLDQRPVDGARTAVVLVTLMGDTVTADLASRRLVAGRVHNPLLFMQATANSVLGYLSREYGITGQQLSISTLDDPLAGALALADVLLDEPDLDEVLIVGAELTGGDRAEAVRADLPGDDRPEAVRGDLTGGDRPEAVRGDFAGGGRAEAVRAESAGGDRSEAVRGDLAGGGRAEGVRGELSGLAAAQGDLAVALLLGRDGGPVVPVPPARSGPPGSLRSLLDLARTTAGGIR